MKLFLILSTLIISNFSYARFETCYNDPRTEHVSYEYNTCIYNNFRLVTRKLNIPMEYCQSFGGSSNIRFVRCINNNFFTAGEALNQPLRECDNTDIGQPRNRYWLNQFFQDCVNRTFRQIDFLIRRRPRS